MVASVRIALALVLGCSVPASANLQLNAKEGADECDGVKIPYLIFSDGQQRVTYGPPRGWRYSEEGDRFVLQPPQNSSAEASIRVLPLPERQIFDDVTLKKLSQLALSSLPQGASRAIIVSEEKNPVIIEQKETYLVVVEYECYGLAYSRSLMFLNRKSEQVQFQLTATRTDFPKLQKAFLGSHFSWQNL